MPDAGTADGILRHYRCVKLALSHLTNCGCQPVFLLGCLPCGQYADTSKLMLAHSPRQTERLPETERLRRSELRIVHGLLHLQGQVHACDSGIETAALATAPS